MVVTQNGFSPVKSIQVPILLSLKKCEAEFSSPSLNIFIAHRVCEICVI